MSEPKTSAFRQLLGEYLERDSDLVDRFNRSLSFQDAMFDRWERAQRLGFGAGTSVYNSALIFGKVSIGENVWIGPYALLDGGEVGLHIGEWCAISSGVQIYTHSSVRRILSGGKLADTQAGTRIGRCCFLASQAIVDPGVELGDHCLVAANSFVNASFPSHSIVAGTPARRIGTVEVAADDVILHYDSRKTRAEGPGRKPPRSKQSGRKRQA